MQNVPHSLAGPDVLTSRSWRIREVCGRLLKDYGGLDLSKRRSAGRHLLAQQLAQIALGRHLHGLIHSDIQMVHPTSRSATRFGLHASYPAGSAP
jgi:hypothetical protein